MLRTICDYHTPIIDIWQKPTLQIKWFYTRQDYEIVLDYLMNILEETSFDYVRYSNGLWYGVTPGKYATQIAWLDQPEKTLIPFLEFIKLIDFKTSFLQTIEGKIENRYTTIYISSKKTLYELYPGVSEQKLQKIIQFIDVNRIEF